MKVYYLPLHSSSRETIDRRLITQVSPERQERIKKYMHISSQKLSLYAALTARMGISLLTGIPAASLVFQAETGKKPKCLSTPGLDFNISHTKNAVLCCISSESSVGADIERRRAAPLNIMRRFFHADETEYVMHSPEQERDLRFFEIWTKKEAYSKQLGLGLTLPPESYNTLSPELSSCLLTWCQDDYICTVCGEKLSSMEKVMITEKTIHKFYMDSLS